ncbi:MAG: crossover junction endodeoxyribonuclease RuvC [Planctomycetota bacterium]
MRILGIDPGLNITGYGVIDAGREGIRLVEAGVVRGTKGASLATRVGEIHAGVADVIASLEPEAVAIEELYSHYERVKTSILMGHARGVIVLAAEQARLPVQSYASTQVKRILTGAGHAPKGQMQLAIQRELGLAAPPEPADVADALAIAVTHWFLSRQSSVVGVAPGDALS